MTKIPSVEQEILKWMNAYIPTGKTIPVFEDMLEQYATEQRDAGGREATNKILNRIKTTQLSGGMVAMKNREAILQALTPPTK
jgi:hypothetical protein